MEIVKLYSSNAIVSSVVQDDDNITAQFIICDFNPNKNGVQLNIDTIDTWLQTLCSKPVVGKVEKNQYGVDDFTSHNVSVVIKTDENGNKYHDLIFDTSAFGSFKSVEIKEINGEKCIVAEAELWRRYENACNVVLERIKAGNLYTSWEVGVLKSHSEVVDGKVTKVIDKGKFLAHCCLSAQVEPAYDSSRILQVAEKQKDDTELADALVKDVIMLSDKHIAKKEENEKLKNNENLEVKKIEQPQDNESETSEVNTTNSTEGANNTENNIKLSALTDHDLRQKLNEACQAKLNDWCWTTFLFPNEKTVWVEYCGRPTELDYKLFTYEVVDDVVTVSDPTDVKLTVSVSEVNSTINKLNSEIETKNSALAEAASTIKSLNDDISNLTPFKDKFEKEEQIRIASENEAKKAKLISSLVKSGLITQEEIETSEEIKPLIDSFNEKELNQIIATRLMASLEKDGVDNDVETSSKVNDTPKIKLVDDETEVSYKLIMDTFLNKK